jgi:ComF family protein
MFASNTAKSLVGVILDFIFPPVCLNCRQLLSAHEKFICNPCWEAIERVHPGHPLYCETREKLLASGVVSNLVSCFVFQSEGAVQRLAHAVKYEGFETLGVWLGQELGRAIRSAGIQADCLIPVPLHKRKFRERGYNQAELVARGIAELIGLPVRTDIVRRKRFTETQTKLDLEQRRKNMEEAFEIVPGKDIEVSGKAYIIVDDVITTGATITSCAGEFVSAGASRVIAASLALAQ